MKTILKVEMKRGLCSKGMVASLVVGMSIILWYQFTYVADKREIMNCYCLESLFYNWIGASCAPMQSYLFFFILPLLAVMPAGATFFDDKKVGYDRNIFIRNKKREYLYAKYIVTFVSAGLAVILPLILSLILTAMRFPALKPEPIMSLGPDSTSMGFELFYTHPFLHTIMFLLIDFVFAGGFAGIALLASFLSEYKFVILIAPFVCYYFIFSLDSLFGGKDISPNYFLIPGFNKVYWWEYVVGFIILLAIGGLFIWKGKRYES